MPNDEAVSNFNNQNRLRTVLVLGLVKEAYYNRLHPMNDFTRIGYVASNRAEQCNF
jgi:hypothetical protein